MNRVIYILLAFSLLISGNSLASENISITPEIIGNDEDNNGVRDDVQAIIEEKYFEDEVALELLLDLARIYQKIISQPLSNKEVHEQLKNSYNVIFCYEDIRSGKFSAEATVIPEQLNTYDRSTIFLLKAAEATKEYGTPQIKSCVQ